MSEKPYQHPDLQRISQKPENCDWELYTDGSGHADGYGGFASLCVSLKHKAFFVRAGAFCGTSTERAEFEALLSGLQGILEKLKVESVPDFAMLEVDPITVFWMSDRESLVGSVARGDDGRHIYRRKGSLDLWARFAFYEKYFKVTAVWRPRDSGGYHNVADRIASECRVLMKDYIEILKHDGSI